MADNKVESSKNNEIGGFKNPEELAKALEENSNERMAKRVREISGKVQDNSIDLRKKLQDELRPEEQLEIRETLPLSGIGKVLNKGLTKDEIESNVGKKVLSGVVGAETADMLEKGEGYFKNFGDAMNLAGKLFEEGKWIAAIGVFFKGLFGKFNLKAWEKKDDEKKEEGKDGEKLGEKLPDNTKYITSLKVILGFSPEKEESTFNILNLPQIKTSNFEKLDIQNSNGILEKLNISYSGNNKTNYEKDVFQAIKLLQQKSDFINDVLGKKNPNWRKELTIEEVLTKCYSYAKIYSSFENFSLTDFRDGKINFGSFSISNPEEGDLNERYEELKNDKESKINGVSKELILQLVGDSNGKISNKDLKNTLLNSHLKEKDQSFINEFIDFGNGILQTIKNNFFLGNEKLRNEFGGYFDNRSLSSKEVFELYLITGGKRNYDEFSGVEKGIIYLKVWSFLGNRPGNHKLRGETYDRNMIEAASGESSELVNKIPRPVIDTVKSMTRYTIETSLGAVWNTTKEIFGLLTTEQKIKYGIASGIVLALLWRVGPLRHLFNGLVIGLTASGVLAIVNQAYKNNPEKFKQQFGNKSPEKLANEMEKEINS